MLEIMIFNLLKGLVPKILPPVQRYFTYVFMILGIIWLNMATYYHFAEEVNKCLGAAICGSIFLVMAAFTRIWEQLIIKKELNQDILNNLVSNFIPLLWPKIFEILKEGVRGKKSAKYFGLIVVIISVYFLLIKKERK